MNLTRYIKYIKSISVVLLAALILFLPGILGSADASRELSRNIPNHPEATSVSSFKTGAGITLAADKYESNFNKGFYNFYDQLDDNQKAVYYELHDKLNPKTKSIKIKLVNEMKYNKNQENQISYDMGRIVQGAFDAFFKDCPEFF